MSESPGGAFIDQFKNRSIPLFLFRFPAVKKNACESLLLRRGGAPDGSGAFFAQIPCGENLYSPASFDII